MAQEPNTPLLLACAAAVRAALAKARSADPVFLSTADKAAMLRSLTTAEAELTSLRLRVLAVSQDVAEETGAKDVAAWCAAELNVDLHVARADLKLARSLDQRWRQVSGALAAGDCSAAQARVIVHALDDLPTGIAVDAGRAEEVLVDHAARFTPSQLRRLGARILEVIDPETAEEQLGKQLQAEEDRAARNTTLTIVDLYDGTVLLNARLPKATGVRLATYLDAFTQPRLARLAENGRTVPYDRLRGQAFTQLLERYDADQLPHHGGDATTVVVTMALDQLKQDLATATIGAIGVDGDITAGEARRLACAARLIPAVLGSHGEVLDLGRTTRLFIPPQRKALRISHPTCATDGCDVPAAWCDAHHLDPGPPAGSPTSTAAPCSAATTTDSPTTPATP